MKTFIVLFALVLAACTGVTATDGVDGADGDRGPRGPRGETGPQGPAGPMGWVEFPQPYMVTAEQTVPPGDPAAGDEGYLTVGCDEKSDILIGGGCSADPSYIKSSLPSPEDVFPTIWICKSVATEFAYTLVGRIFCLPAP